MNLPSIILTINIEKIAIKKPIKKIGKILKKGLKAIFKRKPTEPKKRLY
jgi:hypothetical protein